MPAVSAAARPKPGLAGQCQMVWDRFPKFVIGFLVVSAIVSMVKASSSPELGGSFETLIKSARSRKAHESIQWMNSDLESTMTKTAPQKSRGVLNQAFIRQAQY